MFRFPLEADIRSSIEAGPHLTLVTSLAEKAVLQDGPRAISHQ